jgi:hypothetical protein
MYPNLKSCVDSHDTKLTSYQTSFTDDIVDPTDDLKAAIKSSKENTPGWGDHFENNGVLTKTRAFLKGEELKDLMDCRVARFAVQNFLGSSCEGTNKFAYLSFWMMALGSLLGLLGIMVWCWSLGKM